MKNKKIKVLFFVFIGITITYPFILPLFFGILNLDYGALYTFNMPLNEFTICWMSFWGLICTIVGLYQVYEKVSISRSQHKELIVTQCKQLNTQIHNHYIERYFSCVNMLSSDNEIVRLNAIYNLYIIAREYNTFAESICGNFCDILCSNNTHSKKEKQRVVDYLFNKDCDTFKDIRKEINNCRINGLYFFKVNINEANFNNVLFEDCKIHKSEINDSCFVCSKFKNVLFRTTKIKHSNFRKSTMFEKTVFSRRIEIDDVIFSQATFDGIIFNEGHINGCDFSAAKVRESTFSNIKFIKCILDADEINKSKFHFVDTKYIEDFKKLLPAKYQDMIHIQENVVLFP